VGGRLDLASDPEESYMCTSSSAIWRRVCAFGSGVGVALMAAASASAQGQAAYVLTDGALYSFSTVNPALAAPTPITGVRAGEALVGLDVRPVNGLLYTLGVDAVAFTMSLYLLSPETGLAVPVGERAYLFDLADPRLVHYGLDFDPVTDRLRVTTARDRGINGLNFRLDPNTGALVQQDVRIQDTIFEIDDVAFTSNRPTATATTLYTLSAAEDTLYIQSPPNSGLQTAAVPLNTDLGLVYGFDIDPTVDVSTSNAPVTTGSGFAAVSTAGGRGVVTIDLVTGGVGALAPFANTLPPIFGFAIRGAPVANSFPAVALTADGARLLLFDTSSPGTTKSVAISNVAAGQSLIAIDFRPQTGQLYGLGFNAADNAVQAYRLDPATGAATALGTPFAMYTAGATAFGMDFDPRTDRITVVDDVLNFARIHPECGVATDAVGVILDVPLPRLSAAAYTNSFAQLLDAAAPARLYTLDAALGQLAILTPSRTLSSRLPVTVGGAPPAFTGANGFDIPASVRVFSDVDSAIGTAYASLTVAGVASLYSIDLSTGAAALLGPHPELTNGLAVGAGPFLPTAIALTSSPNDPVSGDVVALSAHLPAAATGTVTFTATGEPIDACGAVPINAGVATCTLAVSGGRSFFAATYDGEGLYPPVRSATTVLDVAYRRPEISITLDPRYAAPGQTVTVTVAAPFLATGTVTLKEGVLILDAVAVGLPASTATFQVTLSNGVHELRAFFDSDDTFFSNAVSMPVTVAVGRFTQHFAEGATGFFQTDVGVINASVTTAANLTLRLFPEGASPFALQFTLPPLGRRSFDYNDLLATLGFSGSVSSLIESDQPIAATRQMTWGAPVYGSTLESGALETSATWYFAEGATNVYSLFYLVENPNTEAATVTFTHLLEGGAAPITHTELVPAQARRTFFINDVPGLAGAALSTVIAADRPVVAERAMYLNTSSRQWEGGTAGAGATTLSRTWSLAEGSTGFFHTYLLLGNPGLDASDATVTYQLPDGTTIERTYAVAPQSRRTIDVGGEDPLLAATTMGMSIAATTPIVAERAMWWGLPFYEGSVALGSTTTGRAWAIGEGAEGGENSESTFVLVANSSTVDGTVRYTVSYDDGTLEEKELALPASARVTTRIADEFPLAIDRRFSVIVETVSPDVAITVEYARYQGSDSPVSAGGAALATRLR
jgi:hypothetical protein